MVVDPSSFAWTDAAWRGVSLEGQVVYELHIGTFTRAGTWAAAAEQLPELARIGITLELILYAAVLALLITFPVSLLAAAKRGRAADQAVRVTFTAALGIPSFWLALLRLVWPMMAMGFVTAIVQRGRASYDRLKAIFDTVPDIQDGPLPAPEKVKGALSVRGLGFEYGARKVLDAVRHRASASNSRCE